MSRQETESTTMELTTKPLRARQAAPPRDAQGNDAVPRRDAVAGPAATRTIRVICVDDHAVLIEGLRAQFAIHGRIEVVGQLNSAARLVEECQQLRPDAVLLDVEMPGPDAFEGADRLRRACPDVRVMILSAHVRDGFISAAFNAGASAYFAKSDEVDDIVDGVMRMVDGGKGAFVLGPRVLERCRAPSALTNSQNRRTANGSSSSPNEVLEPQTLLGSLTTREVEILRLIGKGLGRTQIAARLCRSVKTIDGHQDRMMRKLGIASRADLMRFAIREGLAQA